MIVHDHKPCRVRQRTGTQKNILAHSRSAGSNPALAGPGGLGWSHRVFVPEPVPHARPSSRPGLGVARVRTAAGPLHQHREASGPPALPPSSPHIRTAWSRPSHIRDSGTCARTCAPAISMNTDEEVCSVVRDTAVHPTARGGRTRDCRPDAPPRCAVVVVRCYVITQLEVVVGGARETDDRGPFESMHMPWRWAVRAMTRALSPGKFKEGGLWLAWWRAVAPARALQVVAPRVRVQ